MVRPAAPPLALLAPAASCSHLEERLQRRPGRGYGTQMPERAEWLALRRMARAIWHRTALYIGCLAIGRLSTSGASRSAGSCIHFCDFAAWSMRRLVHDITAVLAWPCVHCMLIVLVCGCQVVMHSKHVNGKLNQVKSRRTHPRLRSILRALRRSVKKAMQDSHLSERSAQSMQRDRTSRTVH